MSEARTDGLRAEANRLHAAAEKYRRTGKLPLQAKSLLGVIRRYPTCFMKQETIAEEMGLCVRTVQRWLNFLLGENLIVCRRTNRTNEYAMATENTRQKVVSEHDKWSYPNTTNGRIRTRQMVVSEHDHLSPIDPAPLYALEIQGGECIEGPEPPPPGAPNPQMQYPPEEKEHRENLRDFESLPESAKARIEALVREQPLYAQSADPTAISIACIRIMLDERRERPFLEFKRKFIALAPGYPKGDSGEFIDAWESSFDRIEATLEEMLQALEDWIDDPRRNNPKWQGGFVRLAKKPILGHIHRKRNETEREQARAEFQATRPEAVEQVSKPPPVTMPANAAETEAEWDAVLLKRRCITQADYDARRAAEARTGADP